MLKSMVVFLGVLIVLGGAAPLAEAQAPLAAAKETKAQRDARMQWWREAKFGLFIHWGLYSVTAGEWNGKPDYGEWIMCNCKILVKTYAQLATQFNPVMFSCA